MENLNFSCALQNDSIFAYNLPVTIDTDGEHAHTHTMAAKVFRQSYCQLPSLPLHFSFCSPPLSFLPPFFPFLPFVVLFFFILIWRAASTLEIN